MSFARPDRVQESGTSRVPRPARLDLAQVQAEQHRLADGDNTPIIKGAALGGLDAASSLRTRRKGWDGVIYGNHRVRKGWDGTVKGVTVAGPDCGGFVTRVVDPRGNVTTAGYDAQGNNVWRMRKRPELLFQPWEERLAYNAHGQLIAVTNAPDANGARRVDKLTYHASGPQAGYLASMAMDEPGVHLTTTFEYDARGNMTLCVDPRGYDWLYTYNALDQLVRAQSPSNVTVRCETTHLLYDANDNLVQCTAELRDETDAFVRNVSRLAEFDLLDRCVALVDQVSPGVWATNRFFHTQSHFCLRRVPFAWPWPSSALRWQPKPSPGSP